MIIILTNALKSIKKEPKKKDFLSFLDKLPQIGPGQSTAVSAVLGATNVFDTGKSCLLNTLLSSTSATKAFRTSSACENALKTNCTGTNLTEAQQAQCRASKDKQNAIDEAKDGLLVEALASAACFAQQEKLGKDKKRASTQIPAAPASKKKLRLGSNTGKKASSNNLASIGSGHENGDDSEEEDEEEEVNDDSKVEKGNGGGQGGGLGGSGAFSSNSQNNDEEDKAQASSGLNTMISYGFQGSRGGGSTPFYSSNEEEERATSVSQKRKFKKAFRLNPRVTRRPSSVLRSHDDLFQRMSRAFQSACRKGELWHCR